MSCRCCVLPVDEVKDVVKKNKNEKFTVEEFVNAASPPQEQSVETKERGVGHFTRVRNCHLKSNPKVSCG